MQFTQNEVREYVEKSLEKYTPTQKQQILSRLHTLQFDNEDELKGFLKETKEALDKEATPEESNEAFKHFRL